MNMEKPDFLFEVCFETCNKVGGIYTVVASKAQKMTELFPNYFIIGPYYKGKSEHEFEACEIPDKYSDFKEVFSELKHEGINCHFGTWNIDGKPYTILIDFKEFAEVLDHLKIRYWEEFKIDSMNSSWDFFEPLLWSTAAGKLIEKFEKKQQGKRIIGHFHEWISSFGILLLKLANSSVKTVFTTHATMLGRSISGNQENLYGMLKTMNPEEEAQKHGVMNKFSVEKACAHEAHAFTTVSEITGLEAEYVLSKKPDVLVLNGLDMREFPKEIEQVQKQSRTKLNMFIQKYFAPYYTVEEQPIIFTSGRYEFHNKGIDVLVESLKKLNEQGEKITALFFVPNGWKNIKENVQKALTSSFKGEGNPPICTHDLENDAGDALLSALRNAGLDNTQGNSVKCIVLPIYLEKDDGVLDMEYYHATAGCDLSIFASYYEPWGYTPVESLAVAVPTITSNLAGFGQFVQSVGDQRSVWVLDRFDKENNVAIEELAKAIPDMISRKCTAEECRSVVEKCDWKDLVSNYEKAYDLVLKK
jgi:phosphorylase/glycogen(starch) synthase